MNPIVSLSKPNSRWIIGATTEMVIRSAKQIRYMRPKRSKTHHRALLFLPSSRFKYAASLDPPACLLPEERRNRGQHQNATYHQEDVVAMRPPFEHRVLRIGGIAVHPARTCWPSLSA